MISVQFFSTGQRAQCAPDPAYPDGIAVDLSAGAPGCVVELPYPAAACGTWLLKCSTCGLVVGVTAAGRPDDPRRVRVACKRPEQVQ